MCPAEVLRPEWASMGPEASSCLLSAAAKAPAPAKAPGLLPMGGGPTSASSACPEQSAAVAGKLHSKRARMQNGPRKSCV